MPAGAERSTAVASRVSVPQSASVTVVPVTGWPRATRFETVLPSWLPPAPEKPVPAEARAVTASAVISPPNSERAVTSLSAFAAAKRCAEVVAEAPVVPAETTEPSDG